MTYLIYLIPLLLVLWWYIRRKARTEQVHRAKHEESVKAGLTEPASLHPAFDLGRCCGSAACVAACPEEAIGIVGGKARLVDPAACIGHGACKAACPVGAITLVFGSERRGVDIPEVKPNFETNVPGLFIAGELGGMGLIRKAAEQGRQAIETIQKQAGKAKGPGLDVAIIGAGPAGLAAGLGATAKNLKYEILEQEPGLGGAIFHYPRHKIAMTAPMNLPVVGKVKFSEVSKEKLLEFWNGVVGRTQLRIAFGERMESIERDERGFRIKTSQRTLEAKTVLLAIGRRGSPRKLGVPGEDLPKVVYRLADPEQYKGHRMVVVGGGDSALEAALALAENGAKTVMLSYRGDAFNRVKAANRQKIEAAAKAKRIDVRMKSNVARIEPDRVWIEEDGKESAVPNDGIVISAGGVLPTELLKKIGVKVETKYGTE